MRVPRLRFTIARLMVLILFVGLAIGTTLEIQARKTYQKARLLREVAEYALKEYEEGIYLQDHAMAQGQIATARSDLERAADRLKWSTAMRAKGQVTTATNLADQLTKQRAEFDLEQAQVQLEVLERYTRQKQLKGLVSDIERARADEETKLKACQSERLWRLWRGSGL